jgi:hypothetical protein
VGAIEVASIPCKSKFEAVEHEADLLHEYRDEHLELPPLNSDEPKRKNGNLMRELKENVNAMLKKENKKELTYDQVRKLLELAKEKFGCADSSCA